MRKNVIRTVIFSVLCFSFFHCTSAKKCTSFSKVIEFSNQTDWDLYFNIAFRPDSSALCVYQTPIGLFKSE